MQMRQYKDIERLVNNFGYKLLKEYIPKGETNRKVIIEDKEGYKYDVYINNLKRYSTSFVDSRNPFVLTNISLWLSRNRPEFELCKESFYKNASTKIKVYHKACDEYVYIRWDDIFQGRGCGICDGRQIGKYNNLSYLRPDLAREWHPDNELSPEEVTCGSGAKTYWICSVCKYGENKEWSSRIADRNKGNGCPSCSGNILTNKNRLSVLFPDIAKEWHPTKNGQLTPDDVSFGSSKKVWWLCPRNHEYLSSINDRTNKKSCKQCADERQESLIATELKKYFKDNYNSLSEYKIFKNPETNHWLPFDIYIPNNIFIEIHGLQHYRFTSLFYKTREQFKYRKKLDRMKRKFARREGIYIEVDLRKNKTLKEYVSYIENRIKK